jgi:hypothetical protein
VLGWRYLIGSEEADDMADIEKKAPKWYFFAFENAHYYYYYYYFLLFQSMYVLFMMYG